MLCITLTKLLPGSISTKLNILGILIPTAATPYVAMITFPSDVLISSYSSFLSASFISPATKTASGICSIIFLPVSILFTNTNVLPVRENSFTLEEIQDILSGSVTNQVYSSW